MIDVDRIKQEASGKWEGIFNQLGLDVPENKKHGACPFCGGKDRFRFSDRTGNGDYYCSQHGYGDGFDLIQKCLGITFIEAAKKVSEIIGIVEMDFRPNTPKKNPSIALNKVWNDSKPLTGKDQVSLYLKSRGITAMPENVRYCEKCYESDTKKNYVAMIAAIHNKKGVKIGIHRTYLEGYKKADIESPKKIMPPVEPLNGSAIRLSYPKDDCLGVSEGLESALSVSTMFGTAVWAVMSTSLMEAFDPPEQYKEIIIYADNDASFAGQKAAYVLATKLYNKGLKVDIRMPPETGQDFNDILMNLALPSGGAQGDG